MKTLTELRTEIELGMIVYSSTNRDVDVRYVDGWYIFGRSDTTPVECESSPGWSHGERVFVDWNGRASTDDTGEGGVIYDDGYRTFEALLADWPTIVSQPVWSTAKSSNMKSYRVTHKVMHPSGENYIVETDGNSETAEEARYHAEEMLQDRYSSLNGWTFQEVSCVENTPEVSAFEALLGDIAIDV